MALKRKLLSALFTFFISVLFIVILTPVDSFFGGSVDYWRSVMNSLLIIPIYVGIGIFLYGLPVSVLSEVITKKWGPARPFFSLSIHIIGGIIPVFVLWFFVIYSVIISGLFYIIDEFLRYYFERIR